MSNPLPLGRLRATPLCLAIAAVVAVGLVVFLSKGAENNCGAWVLQPDGTQWRLCVDSDGKQYCEERHLNDSSEIRLVQCTPR